MSAQQSLDGHDDQHQSLFARRYGGAALDAMFPLHKRAHEFAALVEYGGSAFDPAAPRFRDRSERPRAELLGRFGSGMPAEATGDLRGLVGDISAGFLSGAVNWRSPDLHYNLGAPPTLPSSALYAIGLDANVYLINDGLAGNAIAAETAVSNILSSLSGIPEGSANGLFVFGGTGTIAYAIRCGLAKATPDIVKSGLSKETFVAITEEAHFSHARSSRWLGLGTDQIQVLPVDSKRVTQFEQATALIDARLERGERLASLVLNGGTTYDHSVDDVGQFRRYVDQLVERFQLDYRPHIHVDSVIGWEWLFFRDHSFTEDNDLRPLTRDLLREQAKLVSSAIQNADSWGVDFHKGAGCSPIDCSMVQFNDGRDLGFLNGDSPLEEMHQLASELSSYSPADYTLETSRAGAKALAALGSLHALGVRGYQTVLAGLVEAAQVFREEVSLSSDMEIENPHSRGYQSMVRIFPPDLAGSPLRRTEKTRATQDQASFTRTVNQYIRAFVEWDEENRMSVGGAGPYYSYSSKFLPTPSGESLAGLKFYPTSPRLSNAEARAAAADIGVIKAEFDRLHSDVR